MKDYFINLFEYDKWASNQLLEKFELQFPLNPRIYQLLAHMLAAQRIWLDRTIGIPQTLHVWNELLPEEMREHVENNNTAWIGFLSQLEPANFEAKVHYTNSQGVFDSRLIDIITQVINHNTHHRGNIITMMKEEGYVLPSLDFITFARL
ncbi:DinB family protein [Mucilaginibacter sp. HMF5004]|uniref:DinB family protein n=1 Tax=Mucilaginibacter rivuli TaxID=2857527 RepID=UPI001C5F6C1F|nr:DinB family protein [Mucilaginibacter rivuli]MBW4891857.1 DinB family protein [Mucilaginibacter rivuli]